MSCDYWIFPTIVQADIRQPNGFKMISAMQLDKSLAEEPPSMAIPLGALGKLGETVPKDTLCVSKKYHGVMPKSWPKSLSMRRMTDHGIESPLEAKAPAKNACRTTPPELAELRKQSKKLLGTGFSRPVEAPWEALVLCLKKNDRSLQQCINCRIQNKLIVHRKYPFPALTRLFDRPRRVTYFPKSDIRLRYCRRQINVLNRVLEFHQIKVRKRKNVATCNGKIPKSVAVLCSCLELANSNGQSIKGFLKRASSLTELLKEEDIQWGGNLECQATFDGLKQATIEVASATKPLKVEAEQFNCMFEEYLHHFVDGRQGNLAQLLNVAQFGNNTQIDSLIRRIQFEINGSRHSVLLLLVDGPYVGDNPQVHRVEEEWEQMADIVQVCLEEASRSMEERVDQKRCALEFEWMTKLLINSAITSYYCQLTWNRKKIRKSRKSLLTE
ncbi:RNA-directed DNA polymerase-like protein [Cucumis melo var. makuwa]|uniref:RNA-directed DNA polymerase-like protein n=1 Tax=Cucumis melo var. makuwa TaxID=1194695 RepID=A0A5A7TGC7_CUCMM|nr:RNA-directed DNA polymerase-like protein [Cucumis melo var. makuwa]TYK05674.1 RNA-directed DNA polymerase-like protein [Cucumis melo var. makuwa]